MSKIRFSEEQVENLKKNPNVKNATELGITYTQGFKEHFIEENERGKLPRVIFEEGGFDPAALGIERIASSGKRWRRATKRVEGLKDTRKDSSGRPRTRDLTPTQLIAKLKAENEYLKQMLEFRQELARLERQVAREQRSGRKGNSK
jgi:hypothetical protein